VLTGLFNDQARASDAERWRLEHDAWIDPDSPG
jgi:hypothetical protein